MELNVRQFSYYFQAANATHLWLLSGLTLAFIPHVSHLPASLILFSALLLAWRLAFELHLIKLPGKIIRLLLTIAAITATFSVFHTLLGRQAGVALLVVMLCLKLMEMKQDRDVVVAIGLGYFVVVTVFIFNQSIFMGFYMLFVVILLTTALIAHNREASNIHQYKNLKLASSMLLQAAPLMLLLFVLFPRIPGPLWSLPGDSFGATTGLSDSMSPGKISQLSNNNSVAFRVQFDDQIPPPHQRYWRGPVFNYFDGKTWSKSDDVDVEKTLQQQSNNISYRAIGEPVNYTVTMEPNNQHWLFALEMASVLPPNSDLSSEYEVKSKEPVQQLMRYKIQSFPNYRLSPQITPVMTRYLQLPAKPTQRIQSLLKQWRNESNNNKENIIQLALSHFTNHNFYYTREPPLLLDNPIDEFLFESQRGFCEHYASAFTYLMRASGIPARIVTGYQGGELNPISDYFIVRQSNAHAWSEVWLKDKGWARFDPTSAIHPSRVEHPSDIRRLAPGIIVAPPDWATKAWRALGYRWDKANHFWNQWILNYDNERQRSLMESITSWLGLDDINWRGMVALLFTAMTFVFALIAIRLFTKRKSKQDPATIAYKKFCRKLEQHGLVRSPSEGFNAYSKRACEKFPQLNSHIKKITSLYVGLRYSPHSGSSDLKNLQAAIRELHW